MLNRKTRQRILCLIFAAIILCLPAATTVFATEGEQNTAADAGVPTTDTDESSSGTDGQSGADSESDNQTDTDGESEEPERPEPDAYFEPIQTDSIAGWPAGPAVWAESAVVMDLDSGAFLYSKNMDAVKYPASITKIMTTLLAIENACPNERVTFSENAIYGIERDSSHIGIRVGEILSMEECWYGMMLESANEVCLAVAEHIGGSVEGFVAMMNQKAAELGCTNTHFTNPNGLPDENHYTTAHDMALIAKAAYDNKTFRQVCRTQVYCIPTTNKCGEKRWLSNHHKMLPDGAYAYDGCTGGKTGFTMAALNTLVTYAERDGRRLVCVSLRTNGAQVYTDTASLLDYGFSNFQNITLFSRRNCAGAHMLYPSLYSGHNCTIDSLRPTTVITIPAGAAQDQVQTVYSSDAQNLSRSYLYSEYTVGQESIPNVLFPSQTDGNAQSASGDPNAAGEGNNSGEADTPGGAYPSGGDGASAENGSAETGNILSKLQSIPGVSAAINTLAKLPLYIYLLIFVLIVLIIMEIVLITKKNRRKKRRKNNKEKVKDKDREKDKDKEKDNNKDNTKDKTKDKEKSKAKKNEKEKQKNKKQRR